MKNKATAPPVFFSGPNSVIQKYVLVPGFDQIKARRLSAF